MENRRFERNPDVVFRIIGEDMLLVPIRSSIVDLRSLFTLNETGAFIWEQLFQPRSVQDIQDAVLEEFEVPVDQAKKDLHRFIKQLVQERCIIEVQEGRDT